MDRPHPFPLAAAAAAIAVGFTVCAAAAPTPPDSLARVGALVAAGDASLENSQYAAAQTVKPTAIAAAAAASGNG
jgi:hypothetical protein